MNSVSLKLRFRIKRKLFTDLNAVPQKAYTFCGFRNKFIPSAELRFRLNSVFFAVFRLFSAYHYKDNERNKYVTKFF